MSQVPTVRGPVSSDGLGPTYMYEHIFTLTPTCSRTTRMDRFGLNVETTFEARADTLVEMCRRGYAGSMVLSHDASCYIDWIDPDVLPFMAQWHYLHIGDEVLPYVRDRGVTEDDIGVMLIENPRHFFETAASGGS